MSTVTTRRFSTEPTASIAVGSIPSQRTVTRESGTTVADFDDSFVDDHSETNYLFGHEDPNDFPDGGWKAYSVLLGSTVGITAVYGIPNSVGALQTYLMNHQFKGESSNGLSWMFAVFMFLMYSCGVISGAYFDIVGPKPPMIIGSVLAISGLIATGNCTELWQFYLAFALLVGTGLSFCLSPLMGCTSHYFLKKRGFAGGMASVGGCIGGVIFPLILRKLFVSVGFAWTMRIWALITTFLLGSAYFLIDSRLPRKKTDKSLPLLQRSWKMAADNLDFSQFRDKRFTSLTIGLFATELNCLGTLTYLASYGVAVGFSESQSLVLLTILNGAGIPARIISGTIADKFGRFNVMTVCCLVQNILCWCIWLPFGKNHAALYVFTVIYGMFQSALLALFPACCGQICKAEKFGQVFGALYFCISGANLIGLGVSGVIIGDGSYKGYRDFVIYVSCIGVIGVVGWFSSRYNIAGMKLVKV